MMKDSAIAGILFLAVSAGTLAAQDDGDWILQMLRDKIPAQRVAAAQVLGRGKVTRAIPMLIEALKDEDLSVKVAVQTALKEITNIDLVLQEDWAKWWETDGKKIYQPEVESVKLREVREAIAKAEAALRRGEEQVKRIEGEISRTNENLKKTQEELDKSKQEFKESKSDVRNILYISIFIGALFILVIIYFTAVGYSRLRMWKETIKQADVYIKESSEITVRTNAILEELETKRREATAFFSKLREENTGDIERFCDLLQQKTEHRMREVVMSLREKAEQEIAQTLGEWKKNVEYEIKKNSTESREKIEQISREKEEQLQRSAVVHTMFLDASTYAANGFLDDALKLYKKLLAIKSDHLSAWINLGNVLRELKRYDDAIEAYDKALELSANNPNVFYNIAALYARQRKKEKMLEYLSRSFQNNGDFKDEALNDHTFKEYWHDAAFKDLAEA